MIAAVLASGPLFGDFWKHRDPETGDYDPDLVLAAMRNTIGEFQDIFGDRFYGEIQWNDIPEQHIVNALIIQACTEMGAEVISTSDSHYPRPELWKDREMYRRIGWAGKAPYEDQDAHRLQIQWKKSVTSCILIMGIRCGKLQKYSSRPSTV